MNQAQYDTLTALVAAAGYTGAQLEAGVVYQHCVECKSVTGFPHDDTCLTGILVTLASDLREQIRLALKSSMPNAAPSVWDHVAKRTSTSLLRDTHD